MKKGLVALLVLGVLAFVSCEKKVDIEKEREAIKATFEAEKAGFFNRDFVAMGTTWIKEPSAQKIFMTDKGQTKIIGWENISASDRKATEDSSWDRKLVTVTFSNYQIDIMDESAWVVCDTDWSGVFKDQPMKLRQSRISVLKKTNGEWKFAVMAIYQIPEAQESEN